MKNKITEIVLKEPKKTFMEIMKVHNKEIPTANLLAFFFKPNEKHGLGDLFIKTLLETKCYNLRLDKDKESIEKLYENSTTINKKSVKVKTEFPVKRSKRNDKLKDKDKRIDILIETDNLVICIEFKINHDLDNPLEIYKNYINDNFKDKEKLFVVLTPNKKEPIGKAKEYLDKNNNEFKQVIISHFIKNIKEKWQNDYPILKENIYLQYLEDFIQTIENREIRYRRNEILKELMEKLEVEFKFHNNNKGGFLEKKEGTNSAIKIRVNTSGLQIEKWNNKEKKDVRTYKYIDCKEIISYLNKIKI